MRLNNYQKRALAIIAIIVASIMFIFSIFLYIEDEIRRGRRGRRGRRTEQLFEGEFTLFEYES